MSAWLHSMFATWMQLTLDWGYAGVFVMMAIESTVFPLPSEVVVPPAAYWARQGHMNFWGVVLASTLGSWAGSAISYLVARRLGRPLILKYGKYVLIPPDKFQRVEQFFLRHGEISTFIGRLLPVVRHLISIPAGLSGMNHLKFSLYTLAGAGIWCTVLAWIGYAIGENQDLIMQYSHRALVWVVLFSGVLVAVYVWWQRRRQTH